MYQLVDILPSSIETVKLEGDMEGHRALENLSGVGAVEKERLLLFYRLSMGSFLARNEIMISILSRNGTCVGFSG